MPKLPQPLPFSAPHLIRPEVLLERARAQYHAGDRVRTRALCQQILRADPVNTEALNLLGVLSAEAGQFFEAITRFDEALQIAPDLVETWRNRGLVLSDAGLFEDALASFDQVVARLPAGEAGHLHRAVTLVRLGRFEDAARAYDHLLTFHPTDATLAANRGIPLVWTGRLEEAMASFDLALSLDPGHASAHVNKGMLLLLQGDLPGGARLLEWHARPPALARFLTRPLWLGDTSLMGKTLLVYQEQGFGDAIQFCRFVPWAAQAGAKVILAVGEPLRDLMASLPGVSRIVTLTEEWPQHDLRCPLESLPLAFGATLETIPGETPYLRADPALALAWRNRLADVPGPRIGLVWAGAARPGEAEALAIDQRRSMPLAALEPLALVEGCAFVSLQPGSSAARAMAPPAGMVLHDHTAELRNFADTAALIENLDLVISVDTSVAHLAAAMGKPVWLLNRFDTCWRWLLNRDDSPWYPTLRQFRQPQPGDWASVTARVAESLRGFTASSAGHAGSGSTVHD